MVVSRPPPTPLRCIQVLVFVGLQDFICNVYGNQWWVDSMVWSGRGLWAQAKAQASALGGGLKGAGERARDGSCLCFECAPNFPIARPTTHLHAPHTPIPRSRGRAGPSAALGG